MRQKKKEERMRASEGCQSEGGRGKKRERGKEEGTNGERTRGREHDCVRGIKSMYEEFEREGERTNKKEGEKEVGTNGDNAREGA